MSWMAWTQPTAVFFILVGTSLILMTAIELRWPTRLAKGFLPIATTRGDRYFISLLSAAFIHLLWLGLSGDEGLGAASVLAVIWAAVVMRWG